MSNRRLAVNLCFYTVVLLMIIGLLIRDIVTSHAGGAAVNTAFMIFFIWAIVDTYREIKP